MNLLSKCWVRARFLLPLLFLAAFLPKTMPTLAQVPPQPTSAPAATPSADAVVPIDPWLISPALWQSEPDRFPEARGFRFRWVSNLHDAARTNFPGLRLGDLRVVEVIARFSAAGPSGPAASPGIAPAPAALALAAGKTQLSGIQISIYNRGDAGDLEQKKFDTLVEQAKLALDSLTGIKSVERGVDNTSAVQSQGLVWITPASRFLLEWSATAENRVRNVEYRAEFIRLKITPQRDQPRTALEQMRARSNPTAATPPPVMARASELPARLVKEADGGEWLPNIPMVDQGQKGYCVTAATERILRYYGVEVDQNELAQIANTATTGGTSTASMVAALKKLASRFRINVIIELDQTYADFMREIEEYNRVARNAPKSANLALIDTRVSQLSYESVYNKMNGEILRDARTKLNPAYMGTFERNIEAKLGRGLPLLWSVTLGLLPEERMSPRMRGGHMRLIVGYNARTREVYYSDTWGRGHELKKMPLADAWTITNGLFTLEPA